MGLFATLDRCIHPRLTVESESLRRARIVVGLLLLGLLVNGTIAIVTAVQLGPQFSQAIAALSAALSGWLLFGIKRRGALGLAGDVLVAHSIVVVTVTAAADGLAQSGATYWLPVLPVMAGYIGAHIGVGTATAFCLFATAGLVADAAGMDQIALSAPVDPLVLMRGLALALAVAYSGLAGWLFRTARRSQQAEIARIARRMQTVVDNLSHGIMVVDAEGRILACNERCCELFGVSERHEALVGRAFWSVMAMAGNPPADIQAERTRTERQLQDRDRIEGSSLTLASGMVVERDVVRIRFDGSTDGHLWTFRDVTAFANIAADLRLLAHSDALTGLGNRSQFDLVLSDACALETEPFALLYLDLDGFKPINDQYGHEAGDVVLKEVAQRLRHGIRGEDLAARIGGDEFAVILKRQKSRELAAATAEALRARIVAPIVVDHVEVRVGASFGVALYPDSGASPSVLVRAADTAMYAAKRAGKGRVHLAPFSRRRSSFGATGSIVVPAMEVE